MRITAGKATTHTAVAAPRTPATRASRSASRSSSHVALDVGVMRQVAGRRSLSRQSIVPRAEPTRRPNERLIARRLFTVRFVLRILEADARVYPAPDGILEEYPRDFTVAVLQARRVLA